MSKLTNDQKIEVAKIAKELTVHFGGKIHVTDNSTKEAYNQSLASDLNELYTSIFKTIESHVSEEE